MRNSFISQPRPPDPGEILAIALEVEAWQRELLDAFFDQHPHAVDFQWLLDFPKTGTLAVRGERWTYTKHGLGYRFSASWGCVIDVHNHFKNSCRIIDAHRLAEYFLAALPGTAHGVQDLHARFEQGLRALESQGRLRKVATAPNAWELIESSAPVPSDARLPPLER
ncbi:hypothetical protein M2165_003784 [Variovorax sp. TBS-050B]|uniref:DUF6896 domain-containing protein n=1 Tax=Variovorax sp. TBS-050B TaxID=2940551 RepID=UPI0024752469|nr:hypothetical protein [Variovorax sp. TBS-050B]MDH6593895.1 hypothetical protein [Variovorax sp. TBS-050B]